MSLSKARNFVSDFISDSTSDAWNFVTGHAPPLAGIFVLSLLPALNAVYQFSDEVAHGGIRAVATFVVSCVSDLAITTIGTSFAFSIYKFSGVKPDRHILMVSSTFLSLCGGLPGVILVDGVASEVFGGRSMFSRTEEAPQKVGPTREFSQRLTIDGKSFQLVMR
jgi:hypothetical protein